MILTKEDIKELMRAYQDELDLSFEDVEKLTRRSNVLDSICGKINAWLESEKANYKYGFNDAVNRKIVEMIKKLLEY